LIADAFSRHEGFAHTKATKKQKKQQKKK